MGYQLIFFCISEIDMAKGARIDEFAEAHHILPSASHGTGSSRVVCCQPSAMRPSCPSPFQWCGCPLQRVKRGETPGISPHFCGKKKSMFQLHPAVFYGYFGSIRSRMFSRFRKKHVRKIEMADLQQKKYLGGWANFSPFSFTRDISYPAMSASCEALIV